MADDILQKADGFRLSVDPTSDDVVQANWIIDRLSAKLTTVEAKHKELVIALEDLLHNAVDLLLDERDAADDEGYELWESVGKFRRVICAAGLVELIGDDDE